MPNGDGGKLQGIQTVQVSLNLNALANASCPRCDCPFFETNMAIYKKVPAITSPTGKAQMIRLALGRCADCGLIVIPKEDRLEPISIEEPEGSKEDGE